MILAIVTLLANLSQICHSQISLAAIFATLRLFASYNCADYVIGNVQT